MKKFIVAGILSLLFLSVGLVWLYQLYSKEQKIEKANIAIQEFQQKKESQHEKLLSALADLSNVEKHPDPEERINTLEPLKVLTGDSNNPKEPFQIRSQLELALAIAYYETAEDRLYRTQSLLVLYGNLPSNDMNPLVMENYNSALENYKKAKEEIDKIKEIKGDDDFNFALQYARGNVYYRVLQILAEDDEKREFFEQTALAWERALDFRVKDQDAQINLELLKTNQQQLLMGATDSGLEKLRHIPNLTRPQHSIGLRPGEF